MLQLLRSMVGLADGEGAGGVAVNQAGDTGPANAQAQEQGTFMKIVSFCFRMWLMTTVVNFFKGTALNKTDNSGPATVTGTDGAVQGTPQQQVVKAAHASSCSYRFGDDYQMFIYLNDQETFNSDDHFIIEKRIAGLQTSLYEFFFYKKGIKHA